MTPETPSKTRASRRILLFTLTAAVLLTVASSASAQGGLVPPDCPDEVTVEATNEGNLITATHSGAGGSDDVFHIYRNTQADAALDEDGFPDSDLGWERIATVPDDDDQTVSFLDENVEAGVTYHYAVTFEDEGVEGTACEMVTATAIPFFGAPILGAIAMVGAVGAYAWSSRRKA